MRSKAIEVMAGLENLWLSATVPHSQPSRDQFACGMVLEMNGGRAGTAGAYGVASCSQGGRRPRSSRGLKGRTI